MMATPRLRSLAVALFFQFACTTTTPLVRHIDPAMSALEIAAMKDLHRSFAYALPRTVLRISYSASSATFDKPECTVGPGQGGEGQRDLLLTALQIKEMVKKLDVKKLDVKKLDVKKQWPFKVYTLKDGVLTMTSEPDPNEIFLTTMANERFTDSSLKVVIGADGTIGSSDAAAKDTVGPTVAKVIEVGGAVVAAALPLPPSGSMVTPSFLPAQPARATQSYLASALQTAELLEKYREEKDGLVRVGDEPLNLDNLELSEACRAKAIRYIELEEQRQELLAMRVAHAKDAYELRLNELRGAQDTIRAAFLGLQQTATATIVCDVIPRKVDDQRKHKLALLSFSGTQGVSPGEDADCRIPAEFRSKTSDANGSTSLEVEIQQSDSAFQRVWEAIRQEPHPPSAGFFYRMPGSGVVAIDHTNPALAISPQRVTIAQFGQVVAYPQLRGSNPKLAFELYPDTGALKSVLVEEHAADASAIVGSLGGAAATVLTAEKARRESAEARREKAKDEELGRLQREKGILEATIAIKAARAALGL